ncbi:MAG: DUF6353 family protein [Clostridia bacterium]
MKNKTMIDNVKKSFHKAKFEIIKRSPEILVTVGVLGVVASTVMACKATTKINDILEYSKEEIDKVHDCTNRDEFKEEYTSQDAKKDLAIIYFQTGLKITKLYVPSIILGSLSIGSMVASNNILRERNIALAAAYTTVDKGFKEYRNRVIEKFGQEVENEIRYNIKAQKIEDIITDEETGKDKKVKKSVNVATINESSEYARFFDAGNPYWEKDGDYNFMFLRGQQNYWNDKLMVEGRVFLNDVYDSIGIPKTKAGQIVGWSYDTNNTNIDNYIDFGIFNMHKETNRNFIEGFEPTILLDFNVDGNVWDTMTNVNERVNKYV